MDAFVAAAAAATAATAAATAATATGAGAGTRQSLDSPPLYLAIHQTARLVYDIQ